MKHFKPFTPQAIKAKHDRIEYTLTPCDTFNNVKITWLKYNWQGRLTTTYYSIGEHSSDRKTRPDYKQWTYKLLENYDREFLGRIMTHKDDTLARYENLSPEYNRSLPQEIILKACRLIIKTHNQRLRHAAAARQHPIYKALEPIANKIIEHYKEDFTHIDARVFTNNPRYLIWIVRPMGTHTYTNQYPTKHLESARKTWTDGYMRNPDNRFYFIEHQPGHDPKITRLYKPLAIDRAFLELKAKAEYNNPTAW